MPHKALSQSRSDEPLRIGIIGLVHGHVHGFLHDAMDREDIQVVGVVEADEELLSAYGEQYNIDETLRYTNLEVFLDQQHPEALTVFSNTYDHAAIVESAALRGVHVMMEKPLAVHMDHARTIQEAAVDGGIQVLVNYETTWYASNHYVFRSSIENEKLGALRKIVVHDGHWGPKEIGVSSEFLEWLTDPVLNGGGALTDFGCYGANLMTWLLEGQQPLAVTAITQQLKTDPVYQKVDDEATIIVEYEDTQGIIQASWNWPYHRKDMEVYGDLGLAFAVNPKNVKVMVRGEGEELYSAEPLQEPFNNPLSYLRAVVRDEVEVKPHELSALENNLIVTRILDAARQSAETGERVLLDPGQ